MPPAPAAPRNNNAVASMRSQDQGWFSGAPVTLLLVVGTALAHVVSTRLVKQHQHFYESNRYTVHSVLSRMSFCTTGELVTGTLLLLYLSRKLEREMSSQQYMAWLVTVLPLAAILLQAMSVLLDLLFAAEDASSFQGPYPLLGALFYYFHTFTPRLYPRFVSFLGLAFSEKALIYAWFAQVVVASSSSTVSILPTLCGFLAAALLVASSSSPPCAFSILPVAWFSRLDLLFRRHVQAPPRVLVVAAVTAQNPSGRVPIGVGIHAAQQPTQHQAVGAMAATLAAARLNNNINMGPTQRRGRAITTATAATAPLQQPAVPAEPDPEALEQLINMGFERQQVEQALRYANNNLQRAADRLLQETG